MSSYANFIIEFKEDDTWKTWSALQRFVERKYTSIKDGRVEEVISKPDYDNKELGKFDEVKFIWKQGAVRDLFGITYTGTEIKHSGLPNDVTDETKAVLDKSMTYKTSTTYAYLSDIQDYADSKLGELFKDLENAYERKYSHNTVIKQLNAISADLFNKEIISTKPESEELDVEEDIQYNTKEWIYDIITIQSFCQEIRTLVKEIGNVDAYDSDIRVICWID